MVHTAKALAALVGAFSAGATDVVFAGSGGCDGQDTHCKDPVGNAEAMLWAYTLTNDHPTPPHPIEPLLMLDVHGIPAWMVSAKSPEEGKDCLFVMLANRSTILSFQYSVDGPGAGPGPGPVLKQIGDAVDSHGAAPVHGSISSDGRTLLVANYHGPDDSCSSTGANAASFSIAPSCQLTFADARPHNGSSVIKSRQCGAHVHSFTAGRNGLAFACDLGMDVIFTYKVSADSRLIEVSREAVKPGQGPRHSVMHPTKDVLYVVTEMGSSLLVYSVSAEGKLTLVQTSSTLPVPEGKLTYGSKAAELVMSADGKTLYASNRAFDDRFESTVAVFEVSEDGLAVKVKQQMVTAPYPRGMALSTDGSLLIVESQTTGKVATYKVHTGGVLTALSSVEGPPGASSLMVMHSPDGPDQVIV